MFPVLRTSAVLTGCLQIWRLPLVSVELPWWLRWWRICLQCGRPGFDPWVGKIPWRRAWHPTPVFLPGESPWTEGPGGLQVHGVTKSQTQLSNLACTCRINVCIYIYMYIYISIYIYIYLGSISIDWDKLLINSFKTYTEHLPWVIHQESCNG